MRHFVTGNPNPVISSSSRVFLVDRLAITVPRLELVVGKNQLTVDWTHHKAKFDRSSEMSTIRSHIENIFQVRSTGEVLA